jgi:general secretion pathway protein F
MPQYIVEVLDAPGSVSSRQLQVADVQSVAAALGVAPTQVLSVKEAQSAPRRDASSSGKFPLRLFSHELAVLLDAGIPLLEALHTLREKEQHAGVSATLEALVAALQQGESLSAALRQQPHAFDAIFVASVAASERSGQIAIALREHARFLQWAEQLRSRLVGAAIYPAMLLLVGSAVVMFLLLYVLPRFAGVLDGLNKELPLASVWLIGFGRFAGGHPYATLLAAALLASVPWLLWREPRLRERLVQSAWQAPLLGPRLRVLALARLYRTVGMLLGAGVPLLQSLQLAQGVVAAPWRAALQAASREVEEGRRLSEALDHQALATPVALRMVRVGERSGELSAMLSRAASFHDEELAQLIEFITRAINPLLMLVMGVVIGGIVVLMYLPIFQLVEQVQ